MKARPKQRTMRNVTTAVAGTATATGDERRTTGVGHGARELSREIVISITMNWPGDRARNTCSSKAAARTREPRVFRDTGKEGERAGADISPPEASLRALVLTCCPGK